MVIVKLHSTIVDYLFRGCPSKRQVESNILIFLNTVERYQYTDRLNLEQEVYAYI